jgi:peptide/nickel transport system permease protein
MKKDRVLWQKLVQDRVAFAGFLIVFIVIIVGIFAPYLAPYPGDVRNIHLSERLQRPTLKHLLGTDEFGRDILSRVIFGTRVSFTIALIAVGACLIIGVPIGLYAGFYENWLSSVFMRIGDIFLSVPQIVLALAFASALGRSMPNIILALSVTYWPWFSGIVFAETRKVKKSVFIEATLALGASSSRTIFRHVLPNVLSPIIIRSTVGMGYTILTAAALGFIGVGAPPPTPEWGIAIADARQYLPEAWWCATFPGLAIFLTVMGFNMLGDGLRDLLDPRLRRGGREATKEGE